MIEVWEKGEIVLTLTRFDLEMFFLMRHTRAEIGLFYISPFVETKKNGFKVAYFKEGIWIVKDLEIYPISAEVLKSLLTENKKLVIEWENVKKREAFWVIDFALGQYVEDDDIEYDTEGDEHYKIFVKIMKESKKKLKEGKKKKEKRK